jgi:uncharacterized membrane protein YphA (DoxX/SURF4 family)
MDFVEWACRVVLAATFLVAGVAKLADRSGTRRAAAAFGVPTGAVSAVAIVVPVAELAVAVGLLVPVAGWWAALGALALLVVFSVGIDTALRAGRAPDCHCFGRLTAAPVSRWSIARNAALSGLAIVVLVLAS